MSEHRVAKGLNITRDETTWAFAAHGVTFLEGGVLAPLLLYLYKRDESEFVAFHALQSFYFGAIILAVSLCSCGILAFPALIVYVLYEIRACVAANDGEWYELPLAGAWAWRKHNPETESPRAERPSGPGSG
jgi:uncharacterized membrane protein